MLIFIGFSGHRAHFPTAKFEIPKLKPLKPSTKPKGRNNPKVKDAATKDGKKHKKYDYGPGVEKEKRLPSEKRMDGYNSETKEIHELKPNNPAAEKR